MRARGSVGSIVVALIILTCSMPQPAGGTQTDRDLSDPAQAAVEYSRWEAEGRYGRLYRHMHSDAREIVPRDAVVGWYENDFGPLGPEVIAVTDVSIGSWTWPVTGEVYPETAEVSYQQPFADGSMVSDVIRLVEEDGEWRWFFGRSREFVDEQITRYSDNDNAARGSSQETRTRDSGSARTGTVSINELADQPLRSRDLPDGMSIGTVEVASVGQADGPLLGLLEDDLGATWLNVDIESNRYGVSIQYAVFPTAADAERAYQSDAIRGPIRNGQLADSYVGFEEDPIFDVDALLWTKTYYTPPSSNRVERHSVTAGAVARSNNVLVFTFVSTTGLGEPPLDLGFVSNPAYNLVEAAVRHIETLVN